MGSLYHWYQSSSGSSMASSVTMEEMREELLKEMIDLMIKMREVILTSGLARSEKDIGFDPGGKNSVQSLSVSSLCRVEAVRARDRDFCSLSGDNDANGDEEEDVDEDADYSSDEEDEDDASCEEEDEDDVADGDVDSVGNDDEILNSIGSLGDDSGKVADFFSLGTMVMTDLHQLSQSVAEQFRDTKPQHPWPDEISVSGNESKLHHYDGRRNSQQYCNLEQVYRSRRSIAHLRYRVSVHGRDLEGESQPDYERYRCGDDESYWKKEPEVDKPVMVDKGANLGSLSGGNDAGGGGDDKADIGAVDSAGNNVIFDLNCSFGDAYGEMLCGGMCLRSTVKSGKDAGCFSLGVYCDEVAVNFPHQKISARKPPKDYTLAINNICLSTMATCDPRHGKSMDMLLVYLHDHEQKKNSDLWQYVCELVSAGKLIEIVVLDMKFITMCSLWDCLLVAQEVFDGLFERSLYQSSAFEFVLMLSLENASLLGDWLAFTCNAPASHRRASILEVDVSAIPFGTVAISPMMLVATCRPYKSRSIIGGTPSKPVNIFATNFVFLHMNKALYVYEDMKKRTENLSVKDIMGCVSPLKLSLFRDGTAVNLSLFKEVELVVTLRFAEKALMCAYSVIIVIQNCFVDYEQMMQGWETKLESMTNLNLPAIVLRGFIPLVIFQIGNLDTLDLSNNRISGSFPESIGNYKNGWTVCFFTELDALDFTEVRKFTFILPGLPNIIKTIERVEENAKAKYCWNSEINFGFEDVFYAYIITKEGEGLEKCCLPNYSMYLFYMEQYFPGWRSLQDVVNIILLRTYIWKHGSTTLEKRSYFSYLLGGKGSCGLSRNLFRTSAIDEAFRGICGLFLNPAYGMHNWSPYCLSRAGGKFVHDSPFNNFDGNFDADFRLGIDFYFKSIFIWEDTSVDVCIIQTSWERSDLSFPAVTSSQNLCSFIQFEVDVKAKEMEAAGLHTRVKKLMAELQKVQKFCDDGKVAEKSLSIRWKKIDEWVNYGLIAVYAKWGLLCLIDYVFVGMKFKVENSWNATIGTYDQNEKQNLVSGLFCVMRTLDLQPECFTMGSLLFACFHFQPSLMGKAVHGFVYFHGEIILMVVMQFEVVEVCCCYPCWEFVLAFLVCSSMGMYVGHLGDIFVMRWFLIGRMLGSVWVFCNGFGKRNNLEMNVNICCMQFVTKHKHFVGMVMPNIYHQWVVIVAADIVGGTRFIHLGIADTNQVIFEQGAFARNVGTDVSVAHGPVSNKSWKSCYCLLLSEI